MCEQVILESMSSCVSWRDCPAHSCVSVSVIVTIYMFWAPTAGLSSQLEQLSAFIGGFRRRFCGLL